MPDQVRCCIKGCNEVAVTRGFCRSHYNKLKYHGNPLGKKTTTKKVTVEN